jgi:hypothetical protein
MAHAVPTARRNRAQIFGLLAFVLALAGAVVLWLLAGKRYDDAVADLAPAPVGCETTLVFDQTGTYTFFVETSGSVGEIDGDCATDAQDYDFDGAETPRVELTLVDDDGDEVDLDRASGPSYDRGGSSGAGIRTADIETAGEYLLRVSSEADDVLVRVGRDPSNGVVAIRVGAGLLLALGVVLGIVGLVLGRRSRADTGGYPGFETTWPPMAGEPFTRPTAPPYANPPVPPPYATPPAYPPPGERAPGPGERGGPLPPPTRPPFPPPSPG